MFQISTDYPVDLAIKALNFFLLPNPCLPLTMVRKCQVMLFQYMHLWCHFSSFKAVRLQFIINIRHDPVQFFNALFGVFKLI